MIPQQTVRLTDEQRMKLELYREFGSNANEVYDFLKASANNDAKVSKEPIHAGTDSADKEDGVYIVYGDGSCTPFTDSMTESQEFCRLNAKYVGVRLGGRSVCVALRDLGNREYQFLKDDAERDDAPDFFTDKRGINAFEDFDGARNTERLRSLDTDIPLYLLEDGEYIPSMGEWGLLMMFASRVNKALEWLDAEPIKGYYWSSTEHSSCFAWLCNFGDGYTINLNKSVSYLVRAVAAF